MSEDQLQAELWKWAWNTYPEFRKHMWAVPNGGNRNTIEGQRLKATGLLSGVWDLHVFWKGKFHIIESKVPGGMLTVDRVVNGKKVYGQKEWGALMAAHGATCHIYRTIEQGQSIIQKIIFGS